MWTYQLCSKALLSGEIAGLFPVVKGHVNSSFSCSILHSTVLVYSRPILYDRSLQKVLPLPSFYMIYVECLICLVQRTEHLRALNNFSIFLWLMKQSLCYSPKMHLHFEVKLSPQRQRNFSQANIDWSPSLLLQCKNKEDLLCSHSNLRRVGIPSLGRQTNRC